MTEAEARTWLRVEFGEDALRRLERFVEMLLVEATKQSLIARSTFDAVWRRHIVDSAQLLLLAPPKGSWIDIGSGGGLPGIVVAALADRPIVLIEPRRKRADFLGTVCDALGLNTVRIAQSHAQRITESGSVISARAVATIENVFSWTSHFVSRETVYLLPRGVTASHDLASARRRWQGVFHVKQSITDPSAGIVVASRVQPR